MPDAEFVSVSAVYEVGFLGERVAVAFEGDFDDPMYCPAEA